MVYLTYTVQQVFTPATPAQLNFIDRVAITKQLVDALQTPGKQLIVYGESGSGKSTLLLNKLRQTYADHVTTRCGVETTYEKLLCSAFDQLNPYYVEGRNSQRGRSITPSIRADFLRIKTSIDANFSKSVGQVDSRMLPPQLTAERLAQFLGEQGMCWVVEDFHRMAPPEKLPFAQLLKVFSDMSAEYPDVKTVTIGATETARQVVEYDPDMSKRVSELHVPLMTTRELEDIILHGQELLHVDFSAIVDDIVHYSIGMPAVCHQLALNVCLEKDVTERQPIEVSLTRNDLRPALDRYVNESSDTIKAKFERAFKFRIVRKYDNVRLILAALASGPLPGMSFPDILAKIRLSENKYPKENLRRFLKELSVDERWRLLKLGTDGKYRFVEPVYHTVAKATLVGRRAPKHARYSRYVEDIVATAWLSMVSTDSVWGNRVLQEPDYEGSNDDRDAANGSGKEPDGPEGLDRGTQLTALRERFLELHFIKEMPRRDRAFKEFLNQLFAAFDVESHLGYKPSSEQIRGTLVFDNTEFVVEVKWTQAKVERRQVEALAAKLQQIEPDVPGIFISTAGFSDPCDAPYAGVVLFGIDGDDLFLILDQRIALDEVLRQKRDQAERHDTFLYSARNIILD